MSTRSAASSARPRSPRVSVGLPVYNGETFLARAVESILAQDFEDFELIISDNASTDGTADISRAYARSDERVRYYRHEVNIGAAPNHNHVFGLARASYFKWAAHDDEYSPQLLGACVDVLDRSPSSVTLVYPQADLIDRDGRVTGRYPNSVACPDRQAHLRLQTVLEKLGLGTPVYGVARRDALRKTRLHGSFVSSDLVLIAEMALLGEIRQVPQPLLRKRLHPGRSQEAHHTTADLSIWFDPRNANARPLLPPAYRLTLEYLRSVLRLPLPRAEKAACARVVLKRHRGIRLRRKVRGLLGLRSAS